MEVISTRETMHLNYRIWQGEAYSANILNKNNIKPEVLYEKKNETY
jgi:hypothetical protein